MLQFKCAGCQKTLQVKDEYAGKKVRCPCGHQQAAPQPAQGRSEATAPAAESLVLACSCGKKLRVPASARGKAVRCPCGQTLEVPPADQPKVTARPIASAPPAPAPQAPAVQNSWLDDLPPPAAPAAAPAYWNAPAASAPANPYAAPSQSSTASTYLQQAGQESKQRRLNDRTMVSGSLNTAKWIMIVVGLLTVAVNIFLFLNAEAEVNTVMQQGEAGMDAGTLLLFVRVFYGGFILSGLVMIALGALVYQFPLASPIAGLVIYVLGIVIVALLDPVSLVRGIIFKILIISGLIKAINDGAYYRK